MILPGSFVPQSVEIGPCEHLSFGPVTVEVPALTPASLQEVIEKITEARDRSLAHRPVGEILDVIDQTVTRWLNPEMPFRRVAEEALPHITLFSPQMIQIGVTRTMERLRRDQLWAMLKDELGDPLYLDGFHPRTWGRSKAYGPRLTTQILSGNIPALAAPSFVSALLVKSAILAKPASTEPLFPALFARSLAEVDPELGECIAVLWWKGGDEEREKIAFSQSDLVIAYGGKDTLSHIRTRIPPLTRLIEHGHKVSFGIIGREALSEVKEIATQVAWDVCLFNQQGCLSPHLVYVERGGAVSPKEFASSLAGAMEGCASSLPRGRITQEEALAIRRERGSIEAKEIAGEDVALYEGRGTEWTVIYEADPTFTLSCLNRTIRIKPIGDISEVITLIIPYRQYLQTVGVALSSDRLDDLANKLGRLGVNRICPVGKMQDPPPGWHHDGRFNIRDLIRWVDIEESGGPD